MRIPLAASVLAAVVACRAETVVPLFPTAAGTAGWPTGFSSVADPAGGDRPVLAWDVAGNPCPNAPAVLRDWRDFQEFRFRAYLPAPVDFAIPLVFPCEGGYYIHDWRLDWSGWREHRVRLADCRPAHSPAGWHCLQTFGFRAQGYGQGPVPPGLTVLFADFALATAGDLPEATLAQRQVRERRDRLAVLKAEGNPYFAAVYADLRRLAAEPDLPTSLTSSWQFAGLAGRAHAAAWAAGRDGSPRLGDATLLAHATALVDFMLREAKDGSWFYSRKWESGDPNSDRFALGPLMEAVHWLRQRPEGQAAWGRWEPALRELVEFQYRNWGGKQNHAWGESAREYPNQDVFHLVEMALAHAFWGDPRYRQSVDVTLQGLADHLLPDGGLNYIGPETEIPCYHDLNVLWIARYYDLTRDERARDLLVRTVRYYPLALSNEGRPEYYSDAWWKHYWSDGDPCGPEIIAGLTGDRQNRWLADRLLERVGPGNQYKAIYAGTFYRADLAGEPLPDNRIVLDRNTGGPRGRFGSWYFAATPGGGARDTFVGAMVCEPDRPQPLDGALLAANVEVVADPASPARDRGSLYVSGPDDLTGSACRATAAAFASRYTLRRPYINARRAPDVPPTPWQATQVWVLTRHGLVGLVEVAATTEQTVPQVRGEVRLGPDQPISRAADGSFGCGALRVRVLAHTFADVQAGPARPGYAQTSTRHSAVSLATAGTSVLVRPGAPLHYLVAVGPAAAPAVLGASRLEQAGLWGVVAEFADGAVGAVFNPGDAPADLTLPAGVVCAWSGAAEATAVALRRSPTGQPLLAVPARTVLLLTAAE